MYVSAPIRKSPARAGGIAVGFSAIARIAVMSGTVQDLAGLVGAALRFFG
jgi:hypothetical protein